MSAEGVSRLCDRLVPAGEPSDLDAWAADNASAMPSFHNDVVVVPASDRWEFVAWTDYREARHHRAFTLLTLAVERNDDPALLRRAAEAFDELIASHPVPAVS